MIQNHPEAGPRPLRVRSGCERVAMAESVEADAHGAYVPRMRKVDQRESDSMPVVRHPAPGSDLLSNRGTSIFSVGSLGFGS